MQREADSMSLAAGDLDGNCLEKGMTGGPSRQGKDVGSLVQNLLLAKDGRWCWGLRDCLLCQQDMIERKKEAGLLQPMPVPEKPWVSASMDFLTGLPKVNGMRSIMVIVDPFYKYEKSHTPLFQCHASRASGRLKVSSSSCSVCCSLLLGSVSPTCSCCECPC